MLKTLDFDEKFSTVSQSIMQSKMEMPLKGMQFLDQKPIAGQVIEPD